MMFYKIGHSFVLTYRREGDPIVTECHNITANDTIWYPIEEISRQVLFSESFHNEITLNNWAVDVGQLAGWSLPIQRSVVQKSWAKVDENQEKDARNL